MIDKKFIAYRRVHLVNLTIPHKVIEDIKMKWYHLYALKNRVDWQIFIEIPSEKNIKFSRKNSIFDTLNTKHNENANTEHRPESGQSADY